MEYTTFSISIPAEVAKALEEEATQTFRRKRTRNLLINKILLDRHEAKAPPRPTPAKQPASASRTSRKINSTN